MRHFKLATISPLIFALAFFLCPAQAQATCNWDMPKQMQINQSNNTIIVVDATPVEGGFLGSATNTYFRDVHGDYQPVPLGSSWDENRTGIMRNVVPGVLEGAVEGSNVHFTIHWGMDAFRRIPPITGVYTGTVGPQGRLTGTTYKAEDPSTRADWWVETVIACNVGAPADAPPNDGGKPPVQLGRIEGTNSGPPAPPPVRMGDEPLICARARDARARNSPVAADLEKSCAAAGGSFTDRTVNQAGYVGRDASRFGALSTTQAGQPPIPPPGTQPAAVPGHTFMPPQFPDGARLWACAKVVNAQGAGCAGIGAGKAYCKMRGYSGNLQPNADGTPGVVLGAVRSGHPVRTVNGEACTAENCVAVSELHCAP